MWLSSTVLAAFRGGSWITVNETGNGFAVRRWTDGVSKSIGAWQAQPAGGSLAATDLTLSDAGRIGLVGTCCEPVAGTIFAADGSGSDLASVDRGYRVDGRVRGDLVVRADTAGNLALTRQPEPPYFIESAGAIDVTVMPDGRVVALANPRHISNPDPGPNGPALIVLTSDGGAWTQQRVD